MIGRAFIVAGILITASARADGATPGAAEAARVAVRQALLERLPVPSSPPALPDRALAPALPGSRASTSASEEAERAARARAGGAVPSQARGKRADGTQRGAGEPGDGMMGGSMTDHGGHMDPAEMMKSRGMMPGSPMQQPAPGTPMPGMPHGGTGP